MQEIRQVNGVKSDGNCRIFALYMQKLIYFILNINKTEEFNKKTCKMERNAL